MFTLQQNLAVPGAGAKWPFTAGAELKKTTPWSTPSRLTRCPLLPEPFQRHRQPGYLTRDCIATQFWFYCLSSVRLIATSQIPLEFTATP